MLGLVNAEGGRGGGSHSKAGTGSKAQGGPAAGPQDGPASDARVDEEAEMFWEMPEHGGGSISWGAYDVDMCDAEEGGGEGGAAPDSIGAGSSSTGGDEEMDEAGSDLRHLQGAFPHVSAGTIVALYEVLRTRTRRYRELDRETWRGAWNEGDPCPIAVSGKGVSASQGNQGRLCMLARGSRSRRPALLRSALDQSLWGMLSLLSMPHCSLLRVYGAPSLPAPPPATCIHPHVVPPAGDGPQH